MIKRAILLATALLSACDHAATLPDEARSNYDWFSTLGFPDVKDAKWAEVWHGSWFQGEDRILQAQTLHGFVIKEDDDAFTVLTPDLTVRVLDKSKPGTAAHERIAFEERPFVPMAEAQLQALRNPPKDPSHRFGSHLGQKSEVFALSYFCWRRGEDDLAAKLHTEAEKLKTYWHDSAGQEQTTGMRESLEMELGHAAMWDAVLRMGGGSLSGNSWGGNGTLQPRSELLELFRRIIRLYPRCAHMERAKATVAMLKRMVEEDTKHPVLAPQQIAQLPPDERIAELVFRLRDQNGSQMSQPGWCDVFGYGEGDSAAHQLLEIGYPAAPALIESLTDDRFSRSVGFHRDFQFSHTILTIGDCAQQILSRMTGQNFYSPGSTSGYMSNEDKMLAVQKAARAWHARYQEKGLKQMLVDDLSAGEISPHSLVEQLKAVDPSAVEAAVLAGAANASTDWIVRQFISQLDVINNEKSTVSLVNLMKTHAGLEVRLDAATRLLNRDHPEALPAVLHEWSGYHGGTGGFDHPFDTLTDILACHGSERAIQALVSGWAARPPDQRLRIVEAIGSCMGEKPRDNNFDSNAKPRPPSAAARLLAIELLVLALEDTETNYGISGGRAYGEDSIGDFALYSLHQMDAAKYTYSPKVDRRQREAERIAAANLWRKENGKPLLAPPP
jgi:hypothetical protein